MEHYLQMDGQCGDRVNLPSKVSEENGGRKPAQRDSVWNVSFTTWDRYDLGDLAKESRRVLKFNQAAMTLLEMGYKSNERVEVASNSHIKVIRLTGHRIEYRFKKDGSFYTRRMKS